MSHFDRIYDLTMTKDQLVDFLFGTSPKPFKAEGDIISISNLECLTFNSAEEVENPEESDLANITFDVNVKYKGMGEDRWGKGKAILYTKDKETFTGKIECRYEDLN